MFKNMTMKKHVSMILVVLLVPIYIISSYISYNSKKEALNYYEKNLVETSIKGTVEQLEASKKVYDFIAGQYDNRISQELYRFNKVYEEYKGNPANIDLMVLKAEGPSYLDYYIINKKNIIINSTFAPVLGLDFSSDKPFIVALDKIRATHKLTISKVSTERETGKLRKWAYLPTKDKDYVLEVGLTNEELQKHLKPVDFKELEKLIVKSSSMINSVIIYDAYHRNMTSGELEKDPKFIEILDKVFMTKKAQDIYDEDGILDKKIMYFNPNNDPIDGAGRAIEIEYDNSSIRALLVELRNNSLLLFLGFMALLLVSMNYFVNRFVVNPITELKEIVNKLAKGQLSEHKKIVALKEKYGDNEVGSLASSFYEMAHNLETTLVSRNYLENIIDSVGDIIIITDKKLQITDINHYGLQTLNKKKSEVLKQNFIDYFLEKEKIKEKILELQNKNNLTKTFQIELTMLMDEKKLPVITNVRCHFDDAKELSGFVFSIRDILKLRVMLDEMQENEKVLIQEAQHDPLTGCLNRRGAEEIFEKGLSLNENNKMIFSIVMLDVDDFKGVNDTYGHTMGDKFLVELANILKQYLRKTDYVVRYGGEEFLLVLVGDKLEVAKAIAERVRLHVEKTAFTSENIKRTISGGIAQWNSEDKTLEDVITRADKHLYKSKKKGKNQINFDF